MRSAAALATFLAVGALAGPVLKRDVVTDWEVVLKTVYVTEDVYATATTKKHAAPKTSAAPEPSTTLVKPVKEPKTSEAPPPPPPAPTTTIVQQAAPAPQPVVVTSQPPAPKPAPAVANPAPAPQPGVSDYQTAVVAHHNVHRANHSAPNIQWSQRLADIATEIGNTCVYAHNVDMGGGGYGQNIAAGVAGNNISEIITGMFYNGEVNNYAGQYGLENPDFGLFEVFGHFTQVVWKESTQVGCATVHCAGGLVNTGGLTDFTVCNYEPAGNMGGGYGTNVGEPLNHPTVEWNYGGF